MKALKTLYKGYLAVDKAIKKIISFFCCSSLLILAIFVFICAISRTFFKHSITGSDEFAQYLMVWVVLLAAVLCAEADDLVKVDAVFYLLPDAFKPFIHIIAHAISCVFLAIFFTFVMDTVSRIKVMGTFSVGMPFFPMWLLYLPAVFSALLMSIEYAKLMIKGIWQIIVLRRGKNEDGADNEMEGGEDHA